MKTQKERILDYLLKHKQISGLVAMLELNIMEYRHPIMELRKEGYSISSTWKTSDSGRKYVLYKLEGE